MRERFADLGLPQYLLATLLICTALGIVVAGATSTTAFGAYNPGWDGSQELRSIASDSGADTVVAMNTSAYGTVAPNETTAVILSPTEYDRTSVQRINTFVANGGTLVVAGDFGNGTNDLLQALGVQTRVDGRLVRDERHYWRAPMLPVATDVNKSALPNTEQITLNRGSVLTNTERATIWVNTSGYAYLDTNGNSKLDSEESLTQAPVVAVEQVEAGRIIVVSDPSIFINSMLNREGNHAFATALFAESTTVLFDYSHTKSVPPLVAVVLTLRGSTLLQLFLMGGLFALIGLWSRRPLLTPIRNHFEDDRIDVEPSRDAVTKRLKRQHPEWDDNRIQRVVDRFMDGGE